MVRNNNCALSMSLSLSWNFYLFIFNIILYTFIFKNIYSDILIYDLLLFYLNSYVY